MLIYTRYNTCLAYIYIYIYTVQHCHDSICNWQLTGWEIAITRVHSVKKEKVSQQYKQPQQVITEDLIYATIAYNIITTFGSFFYCRSWVVGQYL